MRDANPRLRHDEMLPLVMSDAARAGYFRLGSRELASMNSMLLEAGRDLPQEAKGVKDLKSCGNRIGTVIFNHFPLMPADWVTVKAEYRPSKAELLQKGPDAMSSLMLKFTPTIVNYYKNCTVRIESMRVEVVLMGEEIRFDHETYEPRMITRRTNLARVLMRAGDDQIPFLFKHVASGIGERLPSFIRKDDARNLESSFACEPKVAKFSFERRR